MDDLLAPRFLSPALAEVFGWLDEGRVSDPLEAGRLGADALEADDNGLQTEFDAALTRLTGHRSGASEGRELRARLAFLVHRRRKTEARAALAVHVAAAHVAALQEVPVSRSRAKRTPAAVRRAALAIKYNAKAKLESKAQSKTKAEPMSKIKTKSKSKSRSNPRSRSKLKRLAEPEATTEQNFFPELHESGTESAVQLEVDHVVASSTGKRKRGKRAQSSKKRLKEVVSELQADTVQVQVHTQQNVDIGVVSTSAPGAVADDLPESSDDSADDTDDDDIYDPKAKQRLQLKRAKVIKSKRTAKTQQPPPANAAITLPSAPLTLTRTRKPSKRTMQPITPALLQLLGLDPSLAPKTAGWGKRVALLRKEHNAARPKLGQEEMGARREEREEKDAARKDAKKEAKSVARKGEEEGSKRRGMREAKRKVAVDTEQAVLQPRVDLPPKPQLLGGGIRSSTFATVLRLVLGLPRPTTPPALPKRAVPPQQPPVWANSRQELCEALPYYRAFQSGMYMYKRVAWGYLLDGYPTPRDTWAADGRVIISHGGGQAVKTLDANGKTYISLAADHTPSDARIETLLQSAARRAPVVLLVGEGYALLPWKLPCLYAVLGWYWVSAAWYEPEPVAPGIEPPEGRDWFRRLKVRFDWVEEQGTPWWLQDGVGAWDPDKAQPVEAATSTASLGGETPTAASPALSSSLEVGKPSPLPPTSPLKAHLRFDGDEMAKPAEHLLFDDVLTHERHVRFEEESHVLPTPPASPTKSDDLCHEFSAPVPMRPAPAAQLPTPPLSPDLIAPRSTIAIQEAIWSGKQVTFNDPPVGFECADEYVPFAALPSAPSIEAVCSSSACLHESRTCATCATSSPRLYEEGWTCLVPTCAAFWMLPTEDALLPIPPGFVLHYRSSFLEVLTTPPDVARPPFSVVPPLPSHAPESTFDDAGSRSLWRGWVCTACGRANCRHRWEVLECVGCKRRLAPQTLEDVVPAAGLQFEDQDLLGEDSEGSSSIPMSVRRIERPGARVVAYELPNAGTVYHVMHDSHVAADAIWAAYQRAAIAAAGGEPLFQRRALKANTVKGNLLSQQFAINSGASYKYIVETLSYAFEDSPACVMDALNLISGRVAEVLGQPVAFNEILSVMYREGQKMSWHDDGEKGLGPVVAALSLGSSALMSFRPKAARSHRSNVFKGTATGERKLPAVLHLHLSHGDVVIMAGRQIQHGYEHRVDPLGVRVAATARVIS